MEYRDNNPRKESRKSKKSARRRKKRGARKAFSAIFVLLIVTVIGMVLSLTVFFKIENVMVTGNAVYSEKELINASGVNKGDNLFLTTTKNVSKNLGNRYPFVEGVNLKRVLPGTLKIEIVEAVEKFCYQTGDKFYSVSEKGKVLEVYSDCPAGLILIRTSSVTEIEVGEYISFSDETENMYFTKLVQTLDKYNISVTRIDASNALSLTVRVDNRFDVNFGSIVDIEGKIAHLSKMMEKIESTKTGTINLSAWSADKNEAYFIQGKLQ